MSSPRVLVIGLDCAPPSLVFGRYRNVMPNVSRLMQRGTWGRLRSTVPPITVPAWTCMVSGRDPGELGLYGFRNRRPRSYALDVATAADVRVKRLWDWLGEAGHHVSVLFVPLTWPPHPVNGELASCFLTPSPEHSWTYPPELGTELEARFGTYLCDAVAHRTDRRDALLEELYAMTQQHFDIATYVWRTKQPDFMMMVEMSPDRLHHAFWDHMDPAHPKYDAASAYAHVGRDYYAFLDERVGALLAEVDDTTSVLVVSDHGARAMQGGVRVNEWLRREGWLGMRGTPVHETPFEKADVDWTRTRAWAEGGYYARVFLNVAGREPEGVVPSAMYESERDRLAHAFETMRGLDGMPLGNVVVKPEDAYRRLRGVAPDLLVFFGDLALRSIGTLGGDSIFSTQNDTSLDSCNHDWDGIFVLSGGEARPRGEVTGAMIYDVARTVLSLMNVKAPSDLLGRDWSPAA